MAELTVQPKRKPVWPWILLAILILAAIAYFVFNRNADGGVFDKRDSVGTDTTYQYSPGITDTTAPR